MAEIDKMTVEHLRGHLAVAHVKLAEREADNERLKGSIEILVHDDVISSGRARELHSMSIQDQRAYWRKQLEPYPIWLEILPESPGLCRVRVRVESFGEWIEVINEGHVEDGGVTSHIVESSGIQAAILKAIDAARAKEEA